VFLVVLCVRGCFGGFAFLAFLLILVGFYCILAVFWCFPAFPEVFGVGIIRNFGVFVVVLVYFVYL